MKAKRIVVYPLVLGLIILSFPFALLLLALKAIAGFIEHCLDKGLNWVERLIKADFNPNPPPKKEVKVIKRDCVYYDHNHYLNCAIDPYLGCSECKYYRRAVDG